MRISLSCPDSDLPRDRQTRARTGPGRSLPAGLVDRIISVCEYNDWSLDLDTLQERFGVSRGALCDALRRRGLRHKLCSDSWDWWQDFDRALDRALDRYERKYGRPGRSRYAQWGYKGAA